MRMRMKKNWVNGQRKTALRDRLRSGRLHCAIGGAPLRLPGGAIEQADGLRNVGASSLADRKCPSPGVHKYSPDQRSSLTELLNATFSDVYPGERRFSLPDEFDPRVCARLSRVQSKCVACTKGGGGLPQTPLPIVAMPKRSSLFRNALQYERRLT